jgi:hypothetical protein
MTRKGIHLSLGEPWRFQLAGFLNLEVIITDPKIESSQRMEVNCEEGLCHHGGDEFDAEDAV